MRQMLTLRGWRPTRLPLAIEITVALLIKTLILTLLWKLCFSTPQTKKMMLPTQQVEQHLLAPSALAAHSTTASHSLTSKAQHDVHR